MTASKTGLPRNSRTKRIYTMDEVKQHNKEGDVWFVVDGKVYDVSKWLEHHPGGVLPLLHAAGREATDQFLSFHPDWVLTDKLPRFQIGVLDASCKNSEFVADFHKLRADIEAQGLFETNYLYYYGQFVWICCVAAAALIAIWYNEVHVLVKVAGPLLLGLFWQQIAFVGHDAGHSGISHVKEMDESLGYIVGNLLGGISMGWWKWSHNTHHVVTNSTEHDPDIQHLPFLAFTENMFTKWFSSYHQKVFSVDRLAHFLLQYQHLVFYPLMAVARFNLYAQSVLFMTSHRCKRPKLEFACTLCFLAGMVYLCSFYATFTDKLLFLLLSHGFAGILHVQITLSHFTMTMYRGHPCSGADVDSWAMLHLATTMDVDTCWYDSWFHGGLQYQIEHHLFPRVPRHNLNTVRQMVRAFCGKHGIAYHSHSFLDANIMLYEQLKRTAEALPPFEKLQMQDYSAGSALKEFRSSMLYDSLNARG